MNFFKNISILRVRLIGAFLILALLPMGLLALLNSQTTRVALIDDANKALFAVASQAAATFDSFYASNIEDVRTEAQLPAFVAYLRDTPNGAPHTDEELAVVNILSTLSERSEFITSYALINNDGLVIADTNMGEIGMDKSDRDYYGIFYQPHDLAAYGSPVRFYKDAPAIYFSGVVLDADGTTLGILRVRYNARVLQTLIEDKNDLAGEGSFGVVFDENHLHLAHGKEPQVNFIPIIEFDKMRESMLREDARLPELYGDDLYLMQLDDLEMHLSNPDTARFFEAEDVATGDLINQVAIAKMEQMPWLVAFFQPQEIFLAPVRTQTNNTLLLVTVFTALAVLVAVVMGNTIANPITRLAESMSTFTSGRRDVRSEIKSSDEIGVLSDNFNSMADRVQTLLADLEAQKMVLEESEERYRQTSELTSDYVYSVEILDNGELDLDWATGAFTRLTGFTSDQLAEKGGWPSLVHPADRERFDEERNLMIATGQQDVSEYRIITQNEEVRWLRDFRRPIVDVQKSRTVRFIGAAQDISTAVKADADLRRAKNAAEMANRAKGSFLANMSHELRTPLNAIIGFSQMLFSSKEIPDKHKEQVTIIRRSGDHLLNLINDVLDMSKIEAGRVTLQPVSFNFNRMLQDVHNLFNLRAEAKGLQLLLEADESLPEYIKADEGKLRQILINIINNAIKFTQEGGVSVRVRYEHDVERRLFFEIEDTGPGIAPEEIENLFEAFVQTASGEKSKEGTGLGLTISREFIRLMGGDVSVVSELDKGTLFKFDVNVELAVADEVDDTEEDPREVVGLAPGQPKFRILIVEDKEPNRILLRQLLEPIGFEIREAVNGKEGVSIWQEWQPDLIWMDMRMPEMDGYEATRVIRSLPGGESTVIIALTASAFEDHRALSLEAGAYDFVRKPFRNQEIFEKMQKHLGIEYVYNDDAIVEDKEAMRPVGDYAPRTLTANDLGEISADLMAELHTAAMTADGEAILAIAETLKAEHPAVATALGSLVDNFRFDMIMGITAQSN